MDDQIKQDAEVRSALSSLLAEISSATNQSIDQEKIARVKSLLDDLDRLVASKQSTNYKEKLKKGNFSNDELLDIAAKLKLELVLINRRLYPMEKRIRGYQQMERALIDGKSIEDVADRLDSTSYPHAEVIAEKLFDLKTHAQSEAKTRSAKHSVSQRADMKEHEPFMNFCRKLLEKGERIEKFKHITGAEGYDKKFDSISERTRRELAKKVGCVFTVGAGRKK